MKPSATNNFSRWDYYGQILEHNTIEISTNSAESINALIGNDSGKGNLPYQKVLFVVNNFKCGYIQKKQNAFNQHDFNKKRLSTVHRECQIKHQVHRFSKLPESEQIDNAIDFATELHATLKSSNSVLQEFAFLPDFDLCK